jgi:hypothetical protein
LEGSGETNGTFGLTTPPAQPPDEMGASMVSPQSLPMILPPQISRIALNPNHFYTPPHKSLLVSSDFSLFTADRNGRVVVVVVRGKAVS